jgi:adenosylmethionine---8-amino-7-oxononanoate aminotransferase
MHPIAELDLKFHWHPFTQMQDWLKQEPIVIRSGRGAVLYDLRGRRYLDANSSIWTNLHGHNHPKLNRALESQLHRIAHVSALGLANPPAARLAARLVELAQVSPQPLLTKAFFSDDGSTAIEVALKLAYEFTRRRDRNSKPRFLSMAGAYHGDTVGAVSLGHISLFHHAYAGLLFKTDQVMAPYCYRCPFNRAQPERADARQYRRCQWECVNQVENQFARATKQGKPYSAFVFEPLIQGAAGMIPQPDGWLQRVVPIARAHGALLIADEVLTAFGRAVCPSPRPGSNSQHPTPHSQLPAHPPILFASQTVQPDFIALAKGLSGGYLPLAATLTTQAVFDAFLGDYAEFKTFFHGHSYTANPLAAATAIASLDLLTSNASMRDRSRLHAALQLELASLWSHSHIGDIRQVGLIAGIELVKDWRTREPFDLREQAGIRVCAAMARRGVLTRPIGNVIVIMPPYCTSPSQVQRIIRALHLSLNDVFGQR